MFGDVVTNINDYFDPGRDGVLPYVAGPHIDPGVATVSRYGSTDEDDFPPTFKRKFRRGDVLLHSRGIEKLAAVDRTGVTGEKLFVLRVKSDAALLQDFLPWLVLSPQAQTHMRANFTGSVNKFLNWKPLASMEVLLPPLDEQRRIADLLWALERHRLTVSARTEACQRVADEVFSASVAIRATETIPLPMLMNEMTVGVVVQPTQYYTDDPAGVPALRGLNIKPGAFDLGDLVRFTPHRAAELKKSTLGPGDVAIVRTGRPGDAAVVTEDIAGFNCIDLIIARPGPGLVPEFLAHFLNSSYGRGQISRLSAGTAQQHFNVGALKKLKIPDIGVDEQVELVERVEGVRLSSGLSRAELEQLGVTRVALLAEVFGGV